MLECRHEMKPPSNYFSEETLSHLKLQHGLSERYCQRAQDVTLACKLTHVYGKYHLVMLLTQLAMSEERTTYQQAERQAAMMNQMTLFHSSPSDFMHTQEESTDESIDTYLEYKRMVEEYSDEQFVPSVVEQFCKMVYEDDDHFIFLSLSATYFSLSMLMRCCGTSKGRLTTRRSAWSSRNSVLKTRYAHISGKAERDGRKPNTSQRKEVKDVYHVNARGGGGV